LCRDNGAQYRHEAVYNGFGLYADAV